MTKSSTPCFSRCTATFQVPKMFVSTAAKTCLSSTEHACRRLHDTESTVISVASPFLKCHGWRYCDLRVKSYVWEASGHLSFNMEKGSLRLIETHYGKRTEGRDLPADSDPIEPAAPVTMTIRPWMRSRIRSRSSCTGFLPSKSSTATSRICLPNSVP